MNQVGKSVTNNRALYYFTAAYTVCTFVWATNAVLVPYLFQLGIFKLSFIEMMMLVVAPILSSAIVKLPLYVLAGKYGAKLVMTVMMLIAALAMYLLSQVSGFVGFFLCSLGFGIAGGGFAVVAGYIEVAFPDEKQTKALNILGGASFGIIVTGLALPQLLGGNVDSTNISAAWRAVPAMISILLFATAVIFYFTNSAISQTGAPRTTMGLVFRVLRTPAVARFSLYGGFLFSVFVTLFHWLIPYTMYSYQLSLPSAGMLAGSFVLIFVLMQILSRWLFSTIGLRSLMGYVFMVCAICLIFLAIPEMNIGLTSDMVGDTNVRNQGVAVHYGMNFWVFVVSCSLLAFVSGIGMGGVTSAIGDYFPDNAGLVASIVNALSVAIACFFLIIFTVLQLEFGMWTAGWFVLAVASIICWFYMQAASRQIIKSEVPNLDQLIESSAHRLIPVGQNDELPSNVETLLQRLPFFHDLTHEALHALAMIGEFKTIASGEIVFEQGDPGDALYVLIEGEVNIFLIGEDDNRIDLAELVSGAYFGDLALIDGQPRSASAKTTQECHFFLISRHQFLSLMSESPRILADVLVGLSEHIRNSNKRYADENEKKARLEVQAELDRHQSIAQMVAGVAHEINTPLGIVNHAASIITEEINADTVEDLAKDEDAEEILEGIALAGKLIQDNIRRADKLITSFKNLSVRQIVDQKENVRISEVIDDVMQLYGLKAQASRLDLIFTNELGEDDLWDGYPGPLSQILLNIISNADRYAYPDGEGGKVEVRLAAAQGDNASFDYVISLRDFGAGIEETDKVFEAFYTTGRSIGGTGIGLSVVYNLVTFQLDGSIELESSLGEGSLFVIYLPKIVKEKHEGTHLISEKK